MPGRYSPSGMKSRYSTTKMPKILCRHGASDAKDVLCSAFKTPRTSGMLGLQSPCPPSMVDDILRTVDVEQATLKMHAASLRGDAPKLTRRRGMPRRNARAVERYRTEADNCFCAIAGCRTETHLSLWAPACHWGRPCQSSHAAKECCAKLTLTHVSMKNNMSYQR